MGGQANEARVQAPTATWWSALERQVDGGWLEPCLGTSYRADCSSELALAHSVLSLTHSSLHLSTHFFIHSTKVYCTRHSVGPGNTAMNKTKMPALLELVV